MNLAEFATKLYSVKALLAGAVVASVVAAGIVTWNYDNEKKDAPAVMVVDEAKKLDSLLTALLRSFAITDACYDSSTRNYLFKIPDHPKTEDTLNEGWYFMKKYHFDQLSNGSWVLSSYGDIVSIEPDVTGLPCKQQARDPSWFR